MTFTSNAKWPPPVKLGNTENVSTDTHETREQAQAVCDRLEREGFGGGGVLFPIETWVEEK